MFAGNRPDQTTVKVVVEDLRQRFGLNRLVLVGGRGMVTLRNLEELRQAQQECLLGLQKRNRQNVCQYLQQAEARSAGRSVGSPPPRSVRCPRRGCGGTGPGSGGASLRGAQRGTRVV